MKSKRLALAGPRAARQHPLLVARDKAHSPSLTHADSHRHIPQLAYHAPQPEKPTAWMTARTNCAPKMKKNVMKLKELSALQGKEHGGEEALSPLVLWTYGPSTRHSASVSGDGLEKLGGPTNRES